MERLPFAQLGAERSAMMERLRQLPIADEVVRQRAVAELGRGVENWWGGALPPITRFADTPSRRRPVVLAADPAELWIARAISPARPAMFGVEANGSVYTVDATGRFQIFVTGLSRLLDEAADICRHVNDGGKFLLVERGRRFFIGLDADDAQAVVHVDVRNGHPRREDRPSATPKSFWQQLVSFLPWTNDEPEAVSPPAGAETTDGPDADAEINSRPVHQLVVDFDAGSWPASGVLKELGYKVGKNGLGPLARRQILHSAFTVELVATSADTESYLREWGAPNTRQRAAKIERCLAGFAENARRRDADMAEAIADWESDLAWFARERSH